MKLYLATGSWLKLHVQEDGSDEVRQDVAGAATAATSAVTYAEAGAVFARRRREGTITAAAVSVIKPDFDSDWSGFVIIEPTMALCRRAGNSRNAIASAVWLAFTLRRFCRLATRAHHLRLAFRASTAS